MSFCVITITQSLIILCLVSDFSFAATDTTYVVSSMVNLPSPR